MQEKGTESAVHVPCVPSGPIYLSAIRVEHGPYLDEHGQSLAEYGPQFCRTRPMLVDFGPNLVEVSPIWPTANQWAMFDPVCVALRRVNLATTAPPFTPYPSICYCPIHPPIPTENKTKSWVPSRWGAKRWEIPWYQAPSYNTSCDLPRICAGRVPERWLVSEQRVKSRKDGLQNETQHVFKRGARQEAKRPLTPLFTTSTVATPCLHISNPSRTARAP